MVNINLPSTTTARRALVNNCEADFEHSIEVVARDIVRDKYRLLTLCGPTCSGKTTTSTKLIECFEKAGRAARVISIDDFFRNKNDDRSTSSNKEINYEGIENVDLPYLQEVISGIFAKERVMLPKYDFPSQSRIGYESYKREHRDIVIFEGIQAVYPEVRTLFSGMYHKKLFVSVTDELTADGVYFSERDIRLMRRIVRDYNFRSASPEFTLYLWKSVVENEDLNIYPNKSSADVQMSSFMSYEPYMMKTAVLHILQKLPFDSSYRKMGDEIAEKLLGLPAIPADYLPPNSVLHEFLG